MSRTAVQYQYLDGSTPAGQRKTRVEAFQSGEGDVFLISLRAGGVGLNLTSADYVIHLDPWWNPAVEDQASDRAHRLGQTRPMECERDGIDPITLRPLNEDNSSNQINEDNVPF